jgi:hypothetical protein
VDYDHSVSQYGVLAVWALNECGMEIPAETWQKFDGAWREHVEKDGSWSYKLHLIGDYQPQSRLSMTCAGIATLFVCKDFLANGRSTVCGQSYYDPHINNGFKYLGDKFRNDPKVFQNLYLCYGLERIGVASGYKYIGGVDWFQQGAQTLIELQKNYSGAFAGHVNIYGYEVGSAALGILFLERGRAPVMMNKLNYADTNAEQAMNNEEYVKHPWNERERDLANLTHWYSDKSERFHNWQVVSLQAPVSDLHDAPILLITGSKKLDFSEADIKKLKQFVDEGGLILGNADCGSPSFSQSFKELGRKIAPSYEFRTLPPNHQIFDEQYKASNWLNPVSLEGLSNGARELMILIPNADMKRDPSAAWQMRSYMLNKELFEVGANIYNYAANTLDLRTNLRFKGDTYILTPDSKTAGGKLGVARLQYGGNWNPEPGGWVRMNAFMHNTYQTDLTVSAVNLGEGKLDNATYKVAHLTGTDPFILSDGQRAEIKKFVDGGGTLIVDACGGNSAFVTSATKELNAIFGNTGPLPLIPASASVYAGAGKAIESVGYRKGTETPRNAKEKPRLRGLQVGERWAVIFSTDDLSCGIVGNNVDGIKGYIPNQVTVDARDGKKQTEYGATEIMGSILNSAK